METSLKPFWAKFFKFDWKFGLFLILLICIPRFFLVLEANMKGNYGSVSIIMIISALAPFIFLSKSGLKQIGLTFKHKKFYRLIFAFISGILLSILLYFIGKWIGGNTYNNWYAYIGKPYNLGGISPHDKLIFFLIYSLTAMTFSPIGEELFFRGIVHSAFEQSVGEKKASVIDSFAFALTHISHFGLVFIDNTWKFLTIPALLWVTAMFFASILFFISKKYSGSIVGAIICHAGFNLGMGYSIFYLL